jgi:hypothetical protein
MRVMFVVVGLALTIAIIVFAIANPKADVEFSALMIVYRGNLLGLAMVLIAFAAFSFGLRVWIKRLHDKQLKRLRRTTSAI